MKCRLSEDWLPTYMERVEGQIVGIVQLLHGGHRRKLWQAAFTELTSAGEEGYGSARTTVEKFKPWEGRKA